MVDDDEPPPDASLGDILDGRYPAPPRIANAACCFLAPLEAANARLAILLLHAIERRFICTGDPNCVVDARLLARRYDIPSPVWVERCIDSFFDEIRALRAAGAAGRPLRREAELIGRALGYGNGPGKTGVLKAAALADRDGAICTAVSRLVEAGVQLTLARYLVAEQWRLSEPIVRKADLRYARLVRGEP